jgi:hypothetical protein
VKWTNPVTSTRVSMIILPKHWPDRTRSVANEWEHGSRQRAEHDDADKDRADCQRYQRPVLAVYSPLGRRDRFLDIVRGMTGKVLGNLAAKNFRQLFVVALAKLAEGAGGSDNDEI